MIKRPKSAFFFLYLTPLLLFALVYVYAGSQEVPEIKDGKIVFITGKTVEYQQKRVLFLDSEEALKKAKPVSISEEPRLIQQWKRIILVRTLNYYESSEKEIVVYDYTGNTLTSPQKIEGEVFFLTASNRIFLAGRSSHNFVNKSSLFDQDGNLVREVNQPENIFDFGFSHDGEIIWILSSYIKEGIPVGQVKVIDSNGNEIKNVDFLKAIEIEVVYKSKAYKISVPQPNSPG